MIPATFDQWRRCITVDCGLDLTPAFCEQRLQALRDPKDYHTDRLTTLYGAQHVRQLIAWFEQAQAA